MSNIQIPNLPVAIGLDGSEQLEIVQYGTSARTTTGAIALLADFGDADPSVDDLEYVFGYNSSGAFKKQEPFGVVQNGANAAPAATDGVSSYVALKDGAMVQGYPLSFEPVTNYGAEPGADAASTTARLNIAVAAHKLLYIPAGAWRLNALTGSERVTWLIDPDATFPDLPTVGPYGQTNLSALGGRIFRISNNLTTDQGIRYGSGNPWPETYRPFSVAISEFSVTSANGAIGVSGFSRASDNPSVNQGTIGGEFIAVNDDVTFIKPTFPGYWEAWRTANAVGAAFCEFESINLGSILRDLNPNTVRSLSSQDSMAAVFAAGGEVAGAQTSTAATATWRNGAYFWRGHVIMANALDPTGPLEAYSIPSTYRLAWYDTVGLLSWVSGPEAQWMGRADADTGGVLWSHKRRKANNTSATDSLDSVLRQDFYGWNGTADYNGGFTQFIQRTDFSAGNARFSYDMQARNSDGSFAQMSLNGVGNNVFAPSVDNSIAIGTSTLRPSRVYGLIHAYTATVFDTFGAGSPEGVLAASVGSTYRRTDGGAGTTFYVKESGTGNTGWVAK